MALPIDRGWAWVITFACGGLFFWIGGNEKNRGIVLVEVMEMYPEQSATSALWIFSVSTIVGDISAPIIGLLLAKTSARFVSMLGVGISTIGMISFAYSPSIECMYLTRGLIFGIGNGMMLLTVFTTSAPYFDKRKGLSLGLTTSCSGVGVLATAISLRKLFDNYSFSGALTLHTGLCIQTMVLAALLRPLSYYSRWVKSSSESGGEVAEEEDNSNSHFVDENKIRKRSQSLGAKCLQENDIDTCNSKDTFLSTPDKLDSLSLRQAVRKQENHHLSSLQILAISSQHLEGSRIIAAPITSEIPSQDNKKKKKSFKWKIVYNPWCIMLGFSALAFASGSNAILQCIPPLGKQIGISKEFVSIVLSLGGVMEIPMRIFHGWLADRKLLPVAVHVGLCMAFTGLMALLCGLLNNTAGMVAAVIGMGSTGTSVSGLTPIIARELFGIDYVESTMAIYFAYMSVSSITSTFASGGIYEYTLHWRNVYYYIAACTISGSALMFVIAFAIRRKAHKPSNELSQSAD
ncbi:monocarboxylate transporter 12-B-like isoform X1 [Watersipora subatra]|uniref:monocarboxylate transporter 12-B-like isoform X1 n=2 Tax=Watersipora subatra TaxID=2589382 RepID=UPI00355BC14C